MSVFAFSRTLRKEQRPDTPVFLLADPHGKYNTTQSLLKKVKPALPQNTQIIAVGDYGDAKGHSNTRSVVDLMLEHAHVCLLGNHDTPVREILECPYKYWPVTPSLDSSNLTVDRKVHHWVTQRLGATTLDSYGVPKSKPQLLQSKMPPEHQAFYRGLKKYHRNGGIFCVHAGLDREKDLENQTLRDYTWSSKEFMESRTPLPVYVVYGHNSIKEGRKPRRGQDCLGIDFGVKYGGPLAGLLITPEGDIGITFVEHAD